MKRLQSCCCVASTKTGTLITAFLGIVASIATIVVVWVLRKERVTFTTFVFTNEFDKTLSDYDIPRIVITVNLCFTILICLLLMVAVHKRRSWLMLPWVVLGFVLAIGLLITILHTSISYYLGEDENRVIIGTTLLVVGLLYLCLYIYLYAVVYSHYLDVRDEEARGRYSKSPYRR